MKIEPTRYAIELEAAKRLAMQAGEIALRFYKKPYETRDKSDQSPVTEADLASSSFLVGELNKKFPKDVVISEEHIPNVGNPEGRIWYVDPLDGTKDFIAGLDEFAVLIGLVESGEPVMGVIYVPITGEKAYAVKDEGAFLETGEGAVVRLTVSGDKPPSERTIIHSRHHQDETLRLFKERFEHSRAYAAGSAGLKCLHIAKGRADIYYNGAKNGLKAWDTAASYVLVTEAGGVFTDVFGARHEWTPQSLYHQTGALIGTPSAHKAALKVAPKPV